MKLNTYLLVAGLVLSARSLPARAQAGSLPGSLRTPARVAPAVSRLRAARDKGAGATVTVRGMVLNGSELGALRFLQDADCGLALYALPGQVPDYDELRAGDSIQVTGQLKTYNGLLEMATIAEVRLLGTGHEPRSLRVPATDLSRAFCEANEGRLLTITGLTRVVTPAGAPARVLTASASYLLDGQPGAVLRLGAADVGAGSLADIALPKDGEAFDVRGVLSQYAPSGSGGYQLLPRLATDLIRGGGLPALVAAPVPMEVTPESFAVIFQTRYPGDTRVSYGPSATALTEQRMQPDFSTDHRLVLSGLLPDTTYYVVVSSRNAAGTATAPVQPFLTSGRVKGRPVRRKEKDPDPTKAPAARQP